MLHILTAEMTNIRVTTDVVTAILLMFSNERQHRLAVQIQVKNEVKNGSCEQKMQAYREVKGHHECTEQQKQGDLEESKGQYWSFWEVLNQFAESISVASLAAASVSNCHFQSLFVAKTQTKTVLQKQHSQIHSSKARQKAQLHNCFGFVRF